MALLPLMERELRVALRKQRPAEGRFRFAMLAAAGSMLFLYLGTAYHRRTPGRLLEELLFVIGLYLVVRAPRLAAGTLADERRDQTLGLLFLSGLSAGEVFASKFLSSALIAFTNLLALFPMMALPFLIGGISFDLFLATICVLPNLMLFALAVTLLASVLTRDDGAAVILASVLGVLASALTPAIYLAQTQFSPGTTPSAWWWRLSPADGPRLIWNGFSSGFRANQLAEFWSNFGLTLVWSTLILGAAAFVLKRIWREQEGAAVATGWPRRWDEIVHSSRASRNRLANTWLGKNPFVWLVARDRQPAALGWLVVGGIVLVWLLCWAAWPTRWFNVPNAFATALLLNAVLTWLTRHTAAQALGRARRDSAYELLLTTPLDPSDIVAGTLGALQCHFRALTNFVFLLNVLLLAGGLVARPWNASALAVYVAIWLCLLVGTLSVGHWRARLMPVMWVSLNCGRPAYAVWRTYGFNAWSGAGVVTWIWIFSNLPNLGPTVKRFPTGSRFELLGIIAAGLWLLTRFGPWLKGPHPQMQDLKWDPVAKEWSRRAFRERATRQCEIRLITEFRDIVREPLPDPADPRFKKWNLQTRFPWGIGLAQPGP